MSRDTLERWRSSVGSEAFLSKLDALTDLGVWQSFLLRVDASIRFALSECTDEKLHVIARKLKFDYKDELVFCADNCGACRLELWLLVDLWARYCLADTQSIEGFNNIVTNATVLAPNM